ncbi:unnamed protein product, partial [Nesidiocoris tenuis]
MAAQVDVLSNFGENLDPVFRGLDVKELLSKGECSFDTDFEAEKAEKEDQGYYDYLDHNNDDDSTQDDFEPGVTTFESLEQDMVDIFDNGKIKKKVLFPGTTQIADSSLVFLHYNFYLEYQPEPFDSSYLRQKNPVKHKLGSDSLILGFEIAVKSMRVNERARFLVHPDYAFRASGVLARIPPNATILMDIKAFSAIACPLNLEEEEPTAPIGRGDFQATYSKARSLLLKGRKCFAENAVQMSVANFEKAARLLLPCSLNNDEEEFKYKKLLMKLYTNLAICYNHQSYRKPEMVCVMFQKARILDVDMAFQNAKLLYQRALAQSALLDFEAAEKNFRYALRVEPQNQEIQAALESLRKRKDSYLAKIDFSKDEDEPVGSEDDQSLMEEETVMDEESKMAASRVLEEFASDDQPTLELSSGYTQSERDYFKSECRRLRLQYSEHKQNNRV